RSTIVGERAFRFKHVLIREVAYGGLTKAERGRLHERFAEWLAARAGEELLEIRAYHLDHATQLQAELDGAPTEALAQDAAAALVDAALEALTEDGPFGALEVRGRIAWWVGDFEMQERMAGEALEIAQRLDRKDLEAHALHEVASAYRQQHRLDEPEKAIRR